MYNSHLVGGVKERVVLPFLQHFLDGLPLFLRGVHACRVVGACVEQDHTSSRGSLQVLDHAAEVEAFGGGVEVTVAADLEKEKEESRYKGKKKRGDMNDDDDGKDQKQRRQQPKIERR